MRISSLCFAGILAAGIAVPVFALDTKGGRPAAPAPAVAAAPQQTPFQAFRAGTELLRSGDTDKALTELRYAAEQGHPLAQWKLGRMYAEGDGVKRDHFQAYKYFSRVASDYAETSPWTQQARFVANAYVSLGSYYLTGIPDSPVVVDKARAHRLFLHAATYFGDADAQYQLARIALDEESGEKNARDAVRWLNLAAPKGHYQAQALLGRILFRGEGVPRDRARGLMWLTLGRDAAAGPNDGWIVQAYEDAFARASEAERSSAYADLQSWMKQPR